MSNHAHAAVIDRIGYRPIIQHFGITRQAVWSWKKNGVPKRHRKTLAMLGAVANKDVGELTDV